MHFYEKNIVEIKNEYTKMLTNILTPLLYEGIKSLYDKAVVIDNENKKHKNVSVFKIFQTCLKDLPNLSSSSIHDETNRIKESCKCSEWLDDLVKAVIKSNIILLTFNASGKQCTLVKNKMHETVNVEMFIHQCYIECARVFFNYPELFWHKLPSTEIKQNQREAFKLVKESIEEAIRKMLPIKMILTEYLNNDYIKEDEKQTQEEKVTDMKKFATGNFEDAIVKNISDDHNKIIELNGETVNDMLLGGKEKNDRVNNEISVEQMMPVDDKHITEIRESIKKFDISDLLFDQPEDNDFITSPQMAGKKKPIHNSKLEESSDDIVVRSK